MLRWINVALPSTVSPFQPVVVVVVVVDIVGV